MEDQKRDAPRPAPNLTAAIRRARVEDAERSEVVAELRGAELARLEMLRDAIEPILAQVPQGVDLFDTGIVPGERPRLFIDMIAFVEMGHDRRTYRFIQDTRHGRVTIAETERQETAIEAITGYIARRLVEREKALASDRTIEQAARALIEKDNRMPVMTPANDVEPAAGAPVAVVSATPETPVEKRSWFATAFLFTIELLGSIVLFVIAAAGFYFVFKALQMWWIGG